MSKVYTYALLSVGMLLILNLMGIPTATNSILEWVGLADPNQVIDTSSFFLAIALVFGIGILGGISLGFLSSASPESYIISTLCSGLLLFIGSFTSVINYSKSATGSDWTSYIILAIMSPIAIGYGIALISYWRGAD